MAPAGKRKRGFNQDDDDESNRPSPHRQNNFGSSQENSYDQRQNHYNSNYPHNQYGGRGGRRPSRGGRGGYSANSAQANPDVTKQPTPNETIASGSGSLDANMSVRQAKFAAPIGNTALAATPVTMRVVETQIQPPTATPAEDLEDSSSFSFEVLTAERILKWRESGKDQVVAEAVEAFAQQDHVLLSMVFQELVRAGANGQINPTDAGNTVRDILSRTPTNSTLDGHSIFLDVLSILMEANLSKSRTNELVLSTGIAPEDMRVQLDETLLKGLGLVRQTFDKVFVRKQTGILYRQSNYNLLREESEGYSKLVTELFTRADSEPPTAEVAGETFQNMMALIGAFDLDPGRALDVTLDVFACLLVKHYRFFVKFLSASSWFNHQENAGLDSETPDNAFSGLPQWALPGHSSWNLNLTESQKFNELKERRDQLFWERARAIGMKAFFELGGRRIVHEADIARQINIAEHAANSSAAEIAETRMWIESTGTLPPRGNAVAAQLLGFKLRFYTSDARDWKDIFPLNVVYLAALLIKIGFITLRDLYPHLHPADESMEGVKEKQMKEKEERELAKRPGGGALNALARAGALTDDTAPPVVSSRLREADTRAATPSKADVPVPKLGTPSIQDEDEEKERLPEAVDQKVELLRSLLCIGAIPDALYLLGRFTWLPDAFPDLPDYIHRITHHSLSKVYSAICPLRDRGSVRQPAAVATVINSNTPNADFRLVEPVAPKTLRWADGDKKDHNGVDYRFYWDDWTDNVPVCQTVDDVMTLCNTLLNISGVKIGQDAPLLTKLARIGKHSLATDGSPANKARWLDLCKKLLCPALSLTKANPAVVNDVFDILKLYPTKVRYLVYAEWFRGSTSRLPDIKDAFDLVQLETKELLKRLNKSDMKPTARMLAKISCASPGVAFAVVLTQIESYSNFVDLVVECGRYFTYMGYDVLTWCLLSTLMREGRSRVTESRINTSPWLSSVSQFSGKIFKRYSVMNPLPILQYLLAQLHQNDTSELPVLKEMIAGIAGITGDSDFNEAQVQAMGGGELLQAQTLRQLLDKRHESTLSIRRFMKNLIDNGLMAPLIITLAQQRQTTIYLADSDVKYVSEKFDQVHERFVQYLEMVRAGLSNEEFQSLVPDVNALISQFGIDPSVAFLIHRKGMARAISAYDAKHGSLRRRSSTGKAQLNEDLNIVDARQNLLDATSDGKASAAAAKEVVQPAEGDKNITDIDVAPPTPSLSASPSPAVASPTDADPVFNPWHPTLQHLIDQLRQTLPQHVQKNMSIPFYVTFWQLSLSDLLAPHKSYTDEDSRQKNRISALTTDRSDMSDAAIQRRDEEIKAASEIRTKLVEEMKTHVGNYQRVRDRLEIEKRHWFSEFTGKWSSLSDGLLQDCFLPRILLSRIDAYFVWRMFSLLHFSGTPEFRSMFFLDRLFGEKMLTNIIFQCTSNEIKYFASFLDEVLREMGSWHADRNTYERRAYGAKKQLPGFAQRLLRDGTPERFLEFEDFRRLLYKWHRHLLDSLKFCLKNQEWKHRANAVRLANAVCRNFPAINWVGTALILAVEGAIATEQDSIRGDVSVAAHMLLGNLKSRQKGWMLPQAFYLNDATKGQRDPYVAPSTIPKSPMPDVGKSEVSAPTASSAALTTIEHGALASAFKTSFRLVRVFSIRNINTNSS